MNDSLPTQTEMQEFSLRAFKGVEAGLGQADPVAEKARKLEAAHPGHLVLVQAGKFLHGFDRTAYVLNTLKQYKLKLLGGTDDPHLRVGFPVKNFKRRLWPIMAEFEIPYVVALGTQAHGYTVYVSEQGDTKVIEAVSPDIMREIILDLRQRGELNKAAAKQLLANPDGDGFKLKARAQDLDTELLCDIVKMTRDVRVAYGENLRLCMARIMRMVFAFGREDNKLSLLYSLSADVDLLKHYITQAPRLKQLKGFKEFSFEHRAGLAIELGRLVGGLIRDYEQKASR